MTYEQIIQKPGKRIIPRIYYYKNGVETSLDRDDFQQAKFKFNASLVGTAMFGVDLETRVELPDATIYIEITARYDDYVQKKVYGGYIIKENPTYNADSKTYSYQLYDKIITAMVDYLPINIEYPTTVYQFFKKLVETLGFTTNIASLPNGDKTMESDIYKGINYTYRDVLHDIGQATATLFIIKENEIKKATFGTSTITINDDILKNQNIALGEHFGPINVIVLTRSGESDSIYYPEALPDNPIEFRIADNQLMNDNERVQYLEAIYNNLKGIEFDIFDTSLVGYGGFDPLAKVKIATGGKEYNSYVFNNEITISQGYDEVIYTEMPEESNTNYKASDTTDKRINQAFILVDKQNQTIETFTNKVDNISIKDNNDYQEILEKFDNYVPISDFVTIEKSVRQLQTDTYTKTEINTKLVDGSVEKVMTTSGTFDENGMHYEKTNAKTKTTINEIGVVVKDSTGSTSKSLLFAGYVDNNNTEFANFKNQTIVGSDNIVVREFLIVGDNSRIQDYEDGGGIFIL